MKEDKLKYNSKISGIFGIIICSYPILFLNEGNIANNQELIYHLENLTKHFQGIENMANVTNQYGLYYYTKVQMIFFLIGMVLTFPFHLYCLIKTYLNSFNNIRKDPNKFVLKINKTSTLMSPIKFFESYTAEAMNRCSTKFPRYN